MLGPLLFTLVTASPEVAVLSTAADSDTTELRFQRVGATELAPAVATFTHVKNAGVEAALLPKTRTVVAVVQTLDTKDPSWASSLLKLEPNRPAVVLADRVGFATRPFVTATGRVFVQRGRAGDDRNDFITLDEVNPRSAATRTVHAFRGYTAFLAGAFDGELVLYRVTPTGADLVAVHPDALGVRTIVPSLAPMARDFALDGRALYFTTADEQGWLISRVDLKTGEQRVMVRGDQVAMLPTVLSHALAWSPGPGRGLVYLDGKSALAAHGDGFERVLFDVRGLLLGLHERPSEFPAAFALEDGRALELKTPPATRLTLAGAVP